MSPPQAEGAVLRGRSSWIAYGLLLTVALALLVWTFLPLWKPLVLAAVLAGTTHGWHAKLSRRIGGRPRFAAALMSVAVVLLFLIPLAALGIVLVREALSAVDYVGTALREGGVEELAGRLPDRLERVVRDLAGRWGETGDGLADRAASSGWKIAALARDVLRSATRVLFAAGMMLVAYFALLVEGAALMSWIRKVLPLPPERTDEIVSEIRIVSRSVLGSTLISAVAQAVFAGIGYLIAGVPHLLFFSFVTGLVALIPILGTPLVALPLAAWLVANGQIWQGVFLAGYAVVVVASVDNIVRPLVVRQDMGLSGVLVFFCLIGGLFAFGGIGLVMGPLAMTLFLALVRISRAAPRLQTM